MNQFKETAAFKNLQGKVCNEVAGVFLARLKEVGVADDRLQQVSEDIGYDIVSAMSEVGDAIIPSADDYLAALKEKTNYIVVLEARVNEMAALEAKVKEMAALEAKVQEMATLEAKVKQMAALEAKVKKMVAFEVKVKEMARLEARVNEVAAQDECFDSVATQEEKTDKIVQIKEGAKAQPQPRVEGVLSQDKVLSILMEANSAFV